MDNETYEQIIVTLVPLLDKNHPTKQMYEFFTRVSGSGGGLIVVLGWWWFDSGAGVVVV